MILVYLEQHGDKLPKSSLTAITAALKMKEQHGYKKVVGLILGSANVEAAAKSAAGFGLDEIRTVTSPVFEHYLAGPFAETVASAAKAIGATAVVGVATSRGKDFLPRVAQQLGGGQASDCVDILPGGIFKRPIFAGNLFAEVEITSAIKVVTVRASAFDSPPATGASAISALSISVSQPTNAEFVKFDTVKNERPELTEAEIVISGGRALGSKENFEKLILPLADAVGAAVGASRAAVDSGYAPNDWQVGQTGKIVAPKLYVAVGISGAIQHLAGMKDSKTIVAINKDAEAPIYEVADYGLVGDLFEVLPELTSKIRSSRGG